jgi:putative transcriptional regulator
VEYQRRTPIGLDIMSLVANIKTTRGCTQSSSRPRYMFGATAIFVVCAVLVPAMRTARETKSAKVTSFFLVASPELSDPLFQQSVILMLPPTQIPLVGGIIINRPTTVPLPKLFSGVPGLKDQATVYFGGPVEITEPSLLLRTSEPTGSVTRLFDDVYVSSDPSSIVKLVRDARPAGGLRLFLGRAQWTLSQLHAETLGGVWYIVPAEADLVFSPDPGRIWRALVERSQLHEVDVTCIQESSAATPSHCTNESACSLHASTIPKISRWKLTPMLDVNLPCWS